ncbi:MAG: bacteriohemerythrin [Treponema sp.]
MDFVTWSDKFSVKVASIDEQHKKLVAVINELYNAMKAGKTKEQMGKILGDLVDYTKYHFSYEEKLLEKVGYKDIVEHKKKHVAFVDKISTALESYKSGKLIMTIDICNFLQDWLIHHIQGTDQKYSQLLVDNGIN